MTVTFGNYSLGVLISRAKKAEADSCGMDENITNLLNKLLGIENARRFITVDSITLNEVELSLLRLL